MVFTTHQNNLIQSVENNLTIILVQEWRFFVESEQSYSFFRFSTKCVVLNSISEVSEGTLNKKKNTWNYMKTSHLSSHFCFSFKIITSAHQDNLIQSVENNLTIILVQEWRFFVESEQSYEFLRFPTKWGFLNSISEVSAWFLNKKKNTWKLHENFTSFIIFLLLIQNYYIK